MKENSESESNSRIFGIMAIVFSFIPLIGLTLGIIATQKGRGGKSGFAVKTGWIGIVLSLVLATGFGYWKFHTIKQDEKQATYESCIKERLAGVSTDGNYSVAEAQCDWARP